MQHITSVADLIKFTNWATPTVVKYTVPGCGPCKAIAPLIDDLAKKYPAVAFAEVNLAENDMADMLNIHSAPQVKLYLGGKLIFETKTNITMLEHQLTKLAESK